MCYVCFQLLKNKVNGERFHDQKFLFGKNYEKNFEKNFFF